MQKQIKQIVRDIPQHWVGDGFPVRSLLSYGDGNEFDPFLLMDYAGPHHFAPAEFKRGVGEHPHKGFETVTFLYQGELEHRDSSGGHGSLGAGDVQWMTAASGIVHEEFHSRNFAEQGGTLEMIQLWVNLRAADKSSAPKYQDLRDAQFPRVAIAQGAGSVRVIAGEFQGTRGPASTFTPINAWDVQFDAPAKTLLQVPPGHTCVFVVQQGNVSIAGEPVTARELVHFERDGSDVELQTDGSARVLILTGQPIGQPIYGQGPFVMNTRAEIRVAIDEYQSGRMGRLA